MIKIQIEDKLVELRVDYEHSETITDLQSIDGEYFNTESEEFFSTDAR